MPGVRALRSGPLRRLVEAAIGLACVAVASLVLDVIDADQTVAALTLVVVGVLLTLVSPIAAIVGVLASFASLNYFFTPPAGEFRLGKGDDLVALLALGITTGILGVTLSRANRLRRQSEVREQEIRARLELSNRLTDGDDPTEVIGDAERALRTLFGLAECRLTPEPDGTLGVQIVEGTHTLTAADRSEIAAFVMGLGTALERVRLTEEVSDARVTAAIEQSRASFLSAMTHNLRTPLATIKAAVSGVRSLAGNGAPGPGADLLDTAYAESDRLERLVNKVLALSTIRAGSLVAHAEPVDLAEATQGAVQRLRLLADERDIALETQPDLPLVHADPALLDVALVNLLENALRHAPESAIEVRGRRDGGQVRIAVVDHGPGIPTTARDEVFDEFVRVDPGNTVPGTGIGLTIAKAFVEAQRGAIEIDETHGGGTTVTITLPVEEGAIA
jgi:two-component system, OmpR family, sensor histidine kinase KdpD